MNLKQCFLTNNECYKAGRTMTVKGLMLHSTGANNPNLRRYVQPDDGLLGKNTYGNHWNVARPGGSQVCVHGFIGKLKDGAIATYQTLPWNMRGWHAGASANDTHIGVEICEDNLTDENYFNEVYKEAVELFAYLCKEFNLNPLQDIICHCEGYKKGIASNHADVMHWFPKFGKSMDTFRSDVNDLVNQSEEKEVEQKPVESNVGSYTVKVTASVLNIRKGPGTNFGTNGQIKDKGVYTIVEEQAGKGADKGWGKLKSGAGWISLDYAEKTNSSSGVYHTVVKGDSRWSLAKKYGTTVGAITDLNPQWENKWLSLKVGAVLRIK